MPFGPRLSSLAVTARIAAWRVSLRFRLPPWPGRPFDFPSTVPYSFPFVLPRDIRIVCDNFLSFRASLAPRFDQAMLGQRILQSYPDLEDYDAPSEPAVFPTGLTVRRTKSAGLRIVTESEVLRSDNSKVRPSRHLITKLCPMRYVSGTCECKLPLCQPPIFPPNQVCHPFSSVTPRFKPLPEHPTQAIPSASQIPPCRIPRSFSALVRALQPRRWHRLPYSLRDECRDTPKRRTLSGRRRKGRQPRPRHRSSRCAPWRRRLLC